MVTGILIIQLPVFINNKITLGKIIFHLPIPVTIYRVSVVVFNATFNSLSVLLVEKTGILGENHRPAASH
jgi:hypothetical protein